MPLYIVSWNEVQQWLSTHWIFAIRILYQPNWFTKIMFSWKLWVLWSQFLRQNDRKNILYNPPFDGSDHRVKFHFYSRNDVSEASCGISTFLQHRQQSINLSNNHFLDVTWSHFDDFEEPSPDKIVTFKSKQVFLDLIYFYWSI